MDYKQFRFYCQTGNLGMIRDFFQDISHEEKEQYLCNVLQTPLRSDVLEYLGTEITRLPPEKGTAILIELFYSEEAAARNLAVELFPVFGRTSLKVLQNHLNDMDPDVRLFVVQSLSGLPFKDEVNELLSKHLPIEKELNIIVAIIEALGDLGGGAAEAEAIRSVTDQLAHPYIEFVGQRALRRLGDDQPVRAVEDQL
ncbi:HEAT repeat domain-containing protein [Paenibacillus turpanensis]|uniref:HEAT repeat domain-containing protein n=1 Tax=Paenibacillus turpanensis TaxID=2689078 RepID=UPI0014093902|nr:hypothetical protein [Paenibacillus turpanensis]